MRIRLISDVHQEAYHDAPEYLAVMDPALSDVVVVAGDYVQVSHRAYADEAVRALCEHFRDQTVIWVPGNHEYWGSTLDETSERLDEYGDRYDNLVMMSEPTTYSDLATDVTFVGATGWYKDTGDYRWSDFSHISDLRSRLDSLHKQDARWLVKELKESTGFSEQSVEFGDIRRKVVAVSHMLPSVFCVAPMWAGDPCNKFFVTDFHDLILDTQPDAWLYGHTHEHVDVRIGKTRCVSAPRGYPHEKNETPFGIIVEV